MLTDEGYRRRFWEGYPHLRRLLGSKDGSVPQGVHPFSLLDDDELRASTDHGPLGRLADVVAIARLLASRSNDVQDAIRADTSSSEGIVDEVRQLRSELEGRIKAFQQAVDRAFGQDIEATRRVARDAEELGRRLLYDRRAHCRDPQSP